MHILICTATYSPQLNGQAVFTRDLAEGMTAREHAVRVLTPSIPGHSSEVTINGVDIVRLPSVRLGVINDDLRMPFRYARRLRAQLDTFRPDVVHVQDPSPMCQALVRAARRRGIPVVATHHPGPDITAPYLTPANPIVKNICTHLGWRFVLRHLAQADLVTVPSRASADMLDRRGAKTQVLTVPCFVRLDDFKPRTDLDRAAIRRRHGLEPDTPLILYTGRIDVEKRVDVMIHAMAELAHPEVHLAIAGHGAQEHEMRRLVGALGLNDRIHFLGNVAHAEIPALMQSADIFAMPGDVESFSISTLEAMACGKPVLATASPALSELIQHGVTGYLFQPRQPQDAAGGIRTLLDARDQWPQMGARNIEKAARYGVARVMGSYERAYQRAAEARRDARRPVRPTPAHTGALLRRMPRAPLLLLAGLTMALTSTLVTQAPKQASAELYVDTLGAVNILPEATLPAIPPHAKDEILGDEGLIYAVLKDRAKVHVVFLTRGDGPLAGPIVVGGGPRTDAPDEAMKLGEKEQKPAPGTPDGTGDDASVVVLLGYTDGKLDLRWHD